MEMLGRPRVTEAGDCVIAWTEIGDGPPIVLLHGLGDSHRTWRRIVPALSRRYRLLLPDLPGHGFSGRPDAPYTLDWYARTMARWLDVVGVERAHVIGHSFGGGVAQWMVLDHRPRIDRMVLVAPGGLGAEVGIGLRLAAFPVLGPLLAPPLMAVGTRALMRIAGAELGHPEPHEIDRIAWMNTMPGSAVSFTRTVAGCIDVFGQTVSAWDRVHEVAELPPIALFWGERDRIVPVKHGRHAFERFEGASFIPYENCGHFPHLERSDRFSEEVMRFLDDAPTRPRLRMPIVARRSPSRMKRFFARIGTGLRDVFRSALRELAA